MIGDGGDDEDNDIDQHMQQEPLPRLTTYKEDSYLMMKDMDMSVSSKIVNIDKQHCMTTFIILHTTNIIRF